MTVATRKYTTFRCAICNRKLKHNRYVYSSHTGRRFCWPGEGCAK